MKVEQLKEKNQDKRKIDSVLKESEKFQNKLEHIK